MSESLNKLKKYVDLITEIKSHEEAIKKLKGDCLSIEEDAMKFFEENGVQNIKIGDRTAYVKKSSFAAFADETIDRDVGIAVLKNSGFSEFAKESINWQALSAALREYGADSIPEELGGTFRLSEKFTIGMRKD